ncbi:DUF2971 domain-containing protein [Mucilaginibacter sp. R-33]|uniref:DUF2971 domain-containing protein n=1 Tax=Mucilaginibacter sp. R-33 TaxID=3416711 RepID=UPI003CE68DF4
MSLEINITTVNRNEITAPTPLYKYRSWTNDHHKSILTARTVWMAPPSSFEDEKEFRNFKRYDLMSNTEIYNKYLAMSLDHNPSWTRQQHRAHAREMTKHPPFRNQKYLKEHQERSYNEYDKRIGVLSLTAIKDSFEMWDYYSDKGNGFSVGFDTLTLFKYMGSGGEVVYPPDGLPVIYGTDDFMVERWKQVYNKEQKWEWEQEYRVELFNPNGLTSTLRKVVLPPECYREVIFGWKIPEEHKIAIREACKQSGLAVNYFQSSLKDGVIIIEAVE